MHIQHTHDVYSIDTSANVDNASNLDKVGNMKPLTISTVSKIISNTTDTKSRDDIDNAREISNI